MPETDFHLLPKETQDSIKKAIQTDIDLHFKKPTTLADIKRKFPEVEIKSLSSVYEAVYTKPNHNPNSKLRDK